MWEETAYVSLLHSFKTDLWRLDYSVAGLGQALSLQPPVALAFLAAALMTAPREDARQSGGQGRGRCLRGRGPWAEVEGRTGEGKGLRA